LPQRFHQCAHSCFEDGLRLHAECVRVYAECVRAR
jgi:hypothetical protein